MVKDVVHPPYFCHNGPKTQEVANELSPSSHLATGEHKVIIHTGEYKLDSAVILLLEPTLIIGGRIIIIRLLVKICGGIIYVSSDASLSSKYVYHQVLQTYTYV